MKKLLLLFGLVMIVQSCGGLSAGILNRVFLKANEKDYVDYLMTNTVDVGLNEEQKNEATIIYTDYFTELKENAKAEKRKEIKNKQSLKKMAYYDFKKQAKFEQILTKNQLIKYHQLIANHDIIGLNEKQMRKQRKHFKKRGYDVDF